MLKLIKNFKGKRLPFSSSIRTYETSYQRNKRLLEESKKQIKELEEKMKISSKDTAEYKNLEEEFKNIQKDMKEKEEKIKDWNFSTKLGIIASILLAVGTLKRFEENRRKAEEEHRKKYPKIDVELAQQLFEKKYLPSSSMEEITNKDIEDTMKKVVDLAKKENAIYLVY
eukprot:gene13229-10247_t